MAFILILGLIVIQGLYVLHLGAKFDEIQKDSEWDK